MNSLKHTALLNAVIVWTCTNIHHGSYKQINEEINLIKNASKRVSIILFLPCKGVKYTTSIVTVSKEQHIYKSYLFCLLSKIPH